MVVNPPTWRSSRLRGLCLLLWITVVIVSLQSHNEGSGSNGPTSYLVASAKDTYEALPTRKETSQEAYARQLENSKKKASPTVWDIIVDINVKRYGRHPSQADCVCATSGEIPKDVSWNVPSFPSSVHALPESQRKIALKHGITPPDAMSFVELETFISQVKQHKAQVDQKVETERLKASNKRNQKLTNALLEEHARGLESGSDVITLEALMQTTREAERAEIERIQEGQRPIGLSKGAYAEGLGDVVLEAMHRTGADENTPTWSLAETIAEQESDYPSVIAEEATGGWSNDDLINSIRKRERLELDAAEVLNRATRPPRDAALLEIQEEYGLHSETDSGEAESNDPHVFAEGEELASLLELIASVGVDGGYNAYEATGSSL